LTPAATAWGDGEDESSYQDQEFDWRLHVPSHFQFLKPFTSCVTRSSELGASASPLEASGAIPALPLLGKGTRSVQAPTHDALARILCRLCSFQSNFNSKWIVVNTSDRLATGPVPDAIDWCLARSRLSKLRSRTHPHVYMTPIVTAIATFAIQAPPSTAVVRITTLASQTAMSRHVFNRQQIDKTVPSHYEWKKNRVAEQSLFADDYVLSPSNYHEQGNQTMETRLRQSDSSDESVTSCQQTDTSSFLNDDSNGADSESRSGDELLEEQRREVVDSSCLRPTWQQEAKIITATSAPLIVTFFLQYSITVVSILAVGRLGKIELGAVSREWSLRLKPRQDEGTMLIHRTVANMSAAISCLTPFQGLATSLDTLCAQAYGSGCKHLVGLQCQRMTVLLLCLAVPVAMSWIYSEHILIHVVPDRETARLAALYLRTLAFAIPGIVVFETGKQFLQSQGLFRATTYILLLASPINAFLHWLLIWKFGMGFLGASIAATVTLNLMAVLLVLYVVFINGSQCWGGFSSRAFTNWWIMIRLVLPGMIMLEAEWLTFEMMTILASRFGTEYLAAQSVLSTLTTISYQVPFPLSIAASTRVANLIGAGRVHAARAFVATCAVVLFNLAIYSALRFQIPILFSADEDVRALVAQTLPLVTVVQVFDGISAEAHGLLRGIGKQFVGGSVTIIAYYGISLPISLALVFGLDWKLDGMWAGVAIGSVVVSLVEFIYLLRTDWHVAAAEAEARNAAG
ncbi:Putative transporter, partial [Tolypocladium paradoxum]